MQKFWNWIAVSSADPSKLSLTLKTVFAVVIKIIISLALIAGGTQIEPGTWQMLFDNLTDVIIALVGLFAIGRKIWLTYYAK